MTPITVLIAHNTYQQRGGEDAVVEAETALLRERGHQVIECRRDNSAIETSSSLSTLAQTLWSRSTRRQVRQLIREHCPDLVHVHNSFPLLSPSIYWAANEARVPVVQTLHNFRLLCAQAMFLRDGRVCEDCLGTLPWRGVVRRCYRGSLPQSAALVSMLALHRGIGSYRHKVTRYIALSEFSRQKFVSAGLPADKLCVKPNFVRANRPITLERTGALFVGRLSAEKGVRVLAKALTQANAACTIVGSGPQEHLFAAQPRARLVGWQTPEAVQDLMRRSAYLIMPSIAYEQFPLVLVEAFANGLPIIASRLGPLAELIRDGETGVLFDAGSAAALAQRIAWAEANPQALRSMGQQARAEYELKYTPERNYQQLMTIYNAAIGEAPSQERQ